MLSIAINFIPQHQSLESVHTDLEADLSLVDSIGTSASTGLQSPIYKDHEV